MPAASPVIDGVTVIVPAPVPLAGDTLSQLALSDAVQSSVPEPAFDTLSVFAAGLEPPAVPLNDRLDGDTDSDGGAGGGFRWLLAGCVSKPGRFQLRA